MEALVTLRATLLQTNVKEMSSQLTIRTIKIPSTQRHWNAHLKRVKALCATSKFSDRVQVPRPKPTADDLNATESINMYLTTDFVFDYDTKPDFIEDYQWTLISKTVYNTLFLGIPDNMKFLHAGVPDNDGHALIQSIRGVLGTPDQQIERFERDFRRNVLTSADMYLIWYGELMDIYSQWNLIHNLPERDHMDDRKLRIKFVSGIAQVFPSVTTLADADASKTVTDLNGLVRIELERRDVDVKVEAPSSSSSSSSSSSDDPLLANYAADGYSLSEQQMYDWGGPLYEDALHEGSGVYSTDSDYNVSMWANGSQGYGHHAGYGRQHGNGHYAHGNRPHPYNNNRRGKGFKGKGAGYGKGSYGKGGYGKGAGYGKGKGFGHGNSNGWQGGKGKGAPQFAMTVTLTDVHTGEVHSCYEAGQVDSSSWLGGYPSDYGGIAQQALQPAPSPTPAPPVSSTLQVAPSPAPSPSPDPSYPQAGPAPTAPGPWWAEANLSFVSLRDEGPIDTMSSSVCGLGLEHVHVAASVLGVEAFRAQHDALHRMCIDSGCNYVAVFFDARFFPRGMHAAATHLRGVTGADACKQGTALCYAQADTGLWYEMVFEGAALQPNSPCNLLALDTLHYKRGQPTAHEVDFRREQVRFAGVQQHGSVALPRDSRLRLQFMRILPLDEFTVLHVPAASVKRLCF